VKAAFLCLAHALIIAMTRLNNDPKYKSCRIGYGLKKPVEEILKDSVVDLSNGGGFEELRQFQEYLSDYKIIVFDGLTLIGSCLVEITFWLRNCTSYTIETLGIMM